MSGEKGLRWKGWVSGKEVVSEFGEKVRREDGGKE